MRNLHVHITSCMLQDFVSLLESYTLRSSEQAVQIAIQAMVDLTKMDPETFHGRFAENVFVLLV